MQRAGAVILGVAALFGVGCAAPAKRSAAVSVDSKVCAGCHAEIYRSYRLTGMASAFSKPSRQAPEGRTARFFHRASATWYEMRWDGGKLIQKRWRVSPGGEEQSPEEREVSYVMGSGNHVRAYLSGDGHGRLIQLPLAWYSERGGYWAMNPGYDAPHVIPPRPVSYECMFCHNAYPKTPAAYERTGNGAIYADPLPEGIDCQRCHGPGGSHVDAARNKAAGAEIRGAIFNPVRLGGDRQMEVCMQCHLQATAYRLPSIVRKFSRAPFSYRAGEPLSDFQLYFDQAKPSGKFEIVSSVYRLRQSACFLKSDGKMTCLTCHDPHKIPRGEEAAEHYNGVCGSCHAALAGAHPPEKDCIGCHMPKRRTYDVVHAVMTDHFIQRRKPAGDLLAAIPEVQETDANAYRGQVVSYYPGRADPLYLAVAQVKHQSNLKAGVEQLQREMDRQKPADAEFYLELGEAWKNAGQPEKAAAAYRQAAVKSPQDARAWHLLGGLQLSQGKPAEAAQAYRTAVSFDPNLFDAFNGLGAILAEGGDAKRAEDAFREAIRLNPNFEDAEWNLGMLMGSQEKLAEAIQHFENGLRLNPDNAMGHLNLGVALAKSGQIGRARVELAQASRLKDARVSAQANGILRQLGGLP